MAKFQSVLVLCFIALVAVCGVCSISPAASFTAVDDAEAAAVIVGSAKPGCCIPEWRPGCATHSTYTCRAIAAGVPANCAASTSWSWLWCLEAYCDTADPGKTQDCETENSSKKRCSNGCRPKGTETTTGCPEGKERCEYDMYTHDDKVCPGGDCSKSTPGTVPGYDHCALIRVCKTGGTLAICDSKRHRGGGALCD